MINKNKKLSTKEKKMSENQPRKPWAEWSEEEKMKGLREALDRMKIQVAESKKDWEELKRDSSPEQISDMELARKETGKFLERLINGPYGIDLYLFCLTIEVNELLLLKKGNVYSEGFKKKLKVDIASSKEDWEECKRMGMDSPYEISDMEPARKETRELLEKFINGPRGIDFYLSFLVTEVSELELWWKEDGYQARLKQQKQNSKLPTLEQLVALMCTGWNKIRIH
jgi:hypothetical protein